MGKNEQAEEEQKEKSRGYKEGRQPPFAADKNFQKAPKYSTLPAVNFTLFEITEWDVSTYPPAKMFRCFSALRRIRQSHAIDFWHYAICVG